PLAADGEVGDRPDEVHEHQRGPQRLGAADLLGGAAAEVGEGGDLQAQLDDPRPDRDALLARRQFAPAHLLLAALHSPHHLRATAKKSSAAVSIFAASAYSSVWCAWAASPGPQMTVGGSP